MQEKDFPEQDELVLCTVDRILGTTVFVKMDSYSFKEGVISTSEIAPGRIRNIRDYVRPGKKIVCKVLRTYQDSAHIDLSLRRVSLKERTKVMSDFEREKNVLAIMKTILKDKTDGIITRIKQEYSSLSDFLQNASEPDYKKIGLNDSEAEQLTKIVKEKPQKKVSVKAKIRFTSDAGDGMIKIKNILLNASKKHSSAEIIYLSSPLYSITITASDYKEANKEMEALVSEMTNEAKANGCRIETAT